MKTLHIVLITLLILILVACGAEQTNTTIVDDVSIKMVVEPSPPTVGESTLIVTVIDKEGNPIEGATVAVHGDMDHEGMTPADSEITDGNDGVYRVPFEWLMGGGWVLNVSVTLPDNAGIATEQFELFVGAISKDSIVNQGNTDTAEIDQSAIENMQSDVQIYYMPDNDPSIVGDAAVVIMVMSLDGQPIDDAIIALNATMSKHNMKPIVGVSSEGVKGRYSIPVNWTMAGDWQVDLIVTLPDAQELTRTYTQQVIMPEDSGS